MPYNGQDAQVVGVRSVALAPASVSRRVKDVLTLLVGVRSVVLAPAARVGVRSVALAPAARVSGCEERGVGTCSTSGYSATHKNRQITWNLTEQK